MTKSVHQCLTVGAQRRGQFHAWSLYSEAGQRKYLNGDERRRFIAAAMQAEPAARTFCLTLAFVGCRISEALALKAGDIELNDGLIAIRSLKKRDLLVVRQVPAPPELLAEIANVHRQTMTGSADGRLWPWSRTHAWQLVKAVMTSAQIYHLPACPKGLRHGFGVHAILCGVPITLIQKWLGHADLATTAIYTNVLGPEEREIAKRMWDRQADPPDGRRCDDVSSFF